MFWYYKVIHKFELNGQNEIKEIGVFSSQEKAFEAIEMVKNKPGFIDYQDRFFTSKFFKLLKPKFLNYIFWKDGFDTYYFNRKSNEICCDEEKNLMKYFAFLLTEYNFRFDKLELGDMVDETGKLWFYGPYNCYYFYNDKLCINFMNLVQRQDWCIYITKEVLDDQNLISKGKEAPRELWYNWRKLASVIKEELAKSNSLFGIPVD